VGEVDPLPLDPLDNKEVTSLPQLIYSNTL